MSIFFFQMKISYYKSCNTLTITAFRKSLFLNIVISTLAYLGNHLVNSHRKCHPTDTNCRNYDFYVTSKSHLTVRSESRFDLEYYRFNNHNSTVGNPIPYPLQWKTFELSGNFLECEKDSVTVILG